MQTSLPTNRVWAFSVLALALACLSQPAWAWDYIVESCPGGQHVESYQEQGLWFNMAPGVKSAAVGCTPGIGSRCFYARFTDRYAKYSFTPPVTATYEISATWQTTSTGVADVSHILRCGTQMLASKLFNQNLSAETGDKWNVIATLTLQAGQTYTLHQGETHAISPIGQVLADAVRFRTDEPCNSIPEVLPLVPLRAGASKVSVAGVFATATNVIVYADGVQIGSNPTPSADITNITVDPPLAVGQVIAAEQVLGGVLTCTPTILGTVSACPQNPELKLLGLLDAGRTVVRVTGVSSDATAVKVYANDGQSDILIGVDNSPYPGVLCVPVSPLVEGQTIKAVQTIAGEEACLPATGRRVTASGIIEDFEGTVTIQDNPDAVAGGQYRVWYDVMNSAYTEVLGPSNAIRGRLFGSKCINITDHGWQNGAYAIYEQVIPADGEYHLRLEMLIDEPIGMDDDFYNSYQVGVLVGANAQHRPTAGSLPAIASPVGIYPCLTPERDGTTETHPVVVYVASFTAAAGDDLLIAFSTDTKTYTRSKATFPTSYPGMKVDNIKLVAGPNPPSCTDVPTPTVTATATAPLEAGRKRVAVQSVLAAATAVTVYADGLPIGTAPATGQALQEVPVTSLVAGQRMSASQTVGGVESCLCPVLLGPIVGAGPNSPLNVSIGIRETGQTSGAIGSDGGSVGPIEWVGNSGFQQLPLGGKPLSLSPGWQTVTFSSSRSGGTDLVRPFTGNGVLEGAFGVLEHIAFTIDPLHKDPGRFVVYIDSIYNGDVLLADFDDPTAFPTGSVAMFREPSRSGSTSRNILPFPNIATVDDTRGADGSSRSYRLEFQFLDVDGLRWLRITSVGSSADAAMPLQNPLIDLTKPITIKFLLAIPQDLDADADVDSDDFRLFTAAFGHSSDHPDYKPDADIDRDGNIKQVDYDLWLVGYRRFVGNPQAIAPLHVLGDFDRNEHVDALDFDHFQGCAAGSGLAIGTESCRDADLDLDADVDQADFAIFQRCLTGSDLAIDLGCGQ